MASFNSFSFDRFRSKFDENASNEDKIRQITEMARTAEAAERYDDMCQFMKELVNVYCDADKNLEVEERNLLSVAYKNVIGTRRASWRVLRGEADSQEGSSDTANKDLVDIYLKQVEAELKETCEEVISILKQLIPVAKKQMEKDAESGSEPCVFYLKMAGDYYRYLAESNMEDETKKKAGEYYNEAFDIASKHLKPTHPIRLGLALNYSVCYYEILKDKVMACDLAKTAFDEAISKLDKLEETDYKDSTLIMQLLRDNLTLWTADATDDKDNVQVEDLSDEDAN
jgi:14-3-3 protein epsilon